MITKHVLKAATLSVALLGGVAVVASVAMPDAAFAKDNGNKGGNDKGADKGNKGNKGGKSGGNEKSTASKGGKANAAGQIRRSQPETQYASIGDAEIEELHPSKKGRWNASNANQAALDAHIRNGNFNGTIGALSQYQLAAKAAEDYDSLTDIEKAALGNIVTFEEVAIEDMDLEAFLNDGAAESDPTFTVVDGVVTCDTGCPEDAEALAALESDAKEALDIYVDMEQELANQEALDGFFDASEQRIIDESNKTLTDEHNEILLDGIAADLGVSRPEAEEVLPDDDDLALTE